MTVNYVCILDLKKKIIIIIIICRTDLPGYFNDVQRIDLPPPWAHSPGGGGAFDDLLTDAALRGGVASVFTLHFVVQSVTCSCSLSPYRILRFILVDGATSKQLKTDLSDLKRCCFFYVSTLIRLCSIQVCQPPLPVPTPTSPSVPPPPPPPPQLSNNRKPKYHKTDKTALRLYRLVCYPSKYRR